MASPPHPHPDLSGRGAKLDDLPIANQRQIDPLVGQKPGNRFGIDYSSHRRSDGSSAPNPFDPDRPRKTARE